MGKRVAAIVPAAGRGIRMGMGTPKQFLTLGGIPLLIHALQVLDRVHEVNEIVLVVPAADLASCTHDILPAFHFTKVIRLVQGGAQRQDSVRHGLEAIYKDFDLALVHDAVRPFLSIKMVREAIEGASQHGACIVAVPMRDTIKRVKHGEMVDSTLDRESLWLAQTPQVFRTALLREAHKQGIRDEIQATDDAALVERLGHPVAIVEGSAENMKITRPEDLVIGEAILASRGLESRHEVPPSQGE
ncbi:MAG: 2-C-methyl-D-erythritol 4-phosphate cytidylyltransferase [Nitrospirales bacterium]|nr:2-C-methyl-D-erythritol 4-phosphate cytidylyltransferase [Nitrospirales bacterium]